MDGADHPDPARRHEARPPTRLRRWAPPVVVAAACFLAFLPALDAGFLNWDDDVNFVHNPHYRGIGAENLRWAFTTRLLGPWQPLSWLSLGIDYELWGMDARGYHLTNVLLHCLGAVLVYLVGLALLARFGPARGAPRARLAAATGALVFAVHPLRVESVAWVTERRDVLSGVLFFACVLAWLRARDPAARRPRWAGAAAVALFGLSLLAKASGMMLPFVLLLLEVWPLRRIRREGGHLRTPPAALVDKLPYLALAVLAGWVAVSGQREAGAMVDFAAHGLWDRLRVAAYGLCFYVHKTVLPLGLSPVYELSEPFGAVPHRFWPHVLIVVAALTGLLLVARRAPAVTVAGLAYAILAAPVLGFAQSGGQLAADRYSYLPCVPFALLAGTAVARWRVAALAAPLVVAALGTATFRQTRVWHDSRSLWTHALEVDPESPRAHYDLGVVLVQDGDLQGVERHFAAAVQGWPWYAHAHNNLAAVLYEQGRVGEAVAHWRRFLQLAPDDPKAPIVREALRKLRGERGR